MEKRPPKSVTGYRGLRLSNYGLAVESPGGGQQLVSFSSYVRRSTHERPWAVVNDYIATTMALAAGVPVPPNALVEFRQTTGHLALAYGEGGMTPPPVDLSQAVPDDPWAATGIMVFDQWLLNEDRHEDNVVKLPGRPLVAIDHDGALLGHDRVADPVSALAGMRERWVVNGAIAQHLTTWEYVTPWTHRIKSVTQEEIRRAAYLCFDSNLVNAAEREAIIDFLARRQDTVGRHMETVRQMFDFDGDLVSLSEEVNDDDTELVPGEEHP